MILALVGFVISLLFGVLFIIVLLALIAYFWKRI